VNRADFERVVDEALAELPDTIRAQLDNLTIVVEAHPHPDQAHAGSGLLGLYEGISLLERGTDYAGFLPDRISIFMDGHLGLGLGTEDTEKGVRKTVLHELGHHLGFDEERLHALGWG
jgi:predicted Zn-dependent protease with MMP-like domain